MTQVNFSGNVFAVLGVACFGALIWSVLEYLLHRFYFHGEDYWMKWLPKSKYIYTFHFFSHGIHHAFPMDRYRLVFPPILGNLFIVYPLMWRPM